MNIKFLILPVTVLWTFTLVGQSLKIDTFRALAVNTTSIVRWECQAGSSQLSKGDYPLIVINGKTFKNCLLQNIFFTLDTTTISSVQILNSKNDGIRLYGKSGKNGVIIITTKKPIEWISARQILKQKAKVILSPYKKTLINVDKTFFDMGEELYFQKSLIDNISVTNNTTQIHLGKQFNSVVTISIITKSGT